MILHLLSHFEQQKKCLKRKKQLQEKRKQQQKRQRKSKQKNLEQKKKIPKIILQKKSHLMMNFGMTE
jgi:hypothetical protein